MMQHGDIFLTRHFDTYENQNTSPGYWNHAAICSDENHIIESTKESGVVKLEVSEWFKSIQNYIVLRYGDKDVAMKAAQYAPSLLNNKYRMISSFFNFIGNRRIRKGLNCVSVVRLSYKYAFAIDPRWVTPDSILNSNLFKIVGKYEEGNSQPQYF